MRFGIRGPREQREDLKKYEFILTRDGWDDFGYKTQYYLSVVPLDKNNIYQEELHIGNVKIIQLSQRETDAGIINSPFDQLDDTFCSVGQSLDYYERLAALGADTRDLILRSLNDVVFNPSLRKKFAIEPGWSTSLFRDTNEKEFIDLATSLLTGDYTSLPSEDLKFRFNLPDWEAGLDFDFSLPDTPWGSGSPLPMRTFVLIGRNGCGKSTLLARLARVAYGSNAERQQDPLSALGSLSPEGIGFPRIVTVSYSAFDSFKIPTSTYSDQERMIRDLENGEGRFVFCGLRDVAQEMRQELKDSRSREYSSKRFERMTRSDRVYQTLLKPIEKQSEEFVRTISKISKEDKVNLFYGALRILFEEPSMSGIREQFDEDTLFAEDDFLHWSTGHKIVMQITASLCAHATAKSLILIDEPETHLHPPLLVVLMRSIRFILKKTKSFAIVATHSPLITQQTLARHTVIVQRESKSVKFRMPMVQTFAENVGIATSEIFGVNSDTADYHKSLENLLEMCETVEGCEEYFGHPGLSAEARAYLLNISSGK